MTHLKSPEEIAVMQKGGKILHDVLLELLHLAKPGITTNYLDDAARRLIRERGAETSFDKVPDYKWSICTAVNEQIVHTPPSHYSLKDGDVLTIDAGVYLGGFHTDHADTKIVGAASNPEIQTFLQKGKETLNKAIRKVRKGGRIGEISKVIQEEIEGAGYSIVKQLTGHGVGTSLHEEPMVPQFLNQPVEKTPVMEPGLVIAVEIMYTMGSGEMTHEKGSRWSLVTKDGSIAAQFEHTIAVTDKNTLILT